jgi:hypothetical protein
MAVWAIMLFSFRSEEIAAAAEEPSATRWRPTDAPTPPSAVRTCPCFILAIAIPNINHAVTGIPIVDNPMKYQWPKPDK